MQYIFKFSFLFRFDPDTDEWQVLESMTSRRVGAGAVTVNRLLFILGGFDGANRLKTVECYYPELNEWRFVAPMHTARSGAGTDDVITYLHSLNLYYHSLFSAQVCVFSIRVSTWWAVTTTATTCQLWNVMTSTPISGAS